jgi:hypothetical protein
MIMEIELSPEWDDRESINQRVNFGGKLPFFHNVG